MAFGLNRGLAYNDYLLSRIEKIIRLQSIVEEFDSPSEVRDHRSDQQNHKSHDRGLFLTDAYGAFRTIIVSSQCLDRRRRRIGGYLEHLVERGTLASGWFVGDQCFLVAAS